MENDIVTSLDLIDYSKYEAVIFDCFGTILNINQKTNPYLFLIKNSPIKNKNISSYLMETPLNDKEISNLFNIDINGDIFSEFKHLLKIELNSIEVFQDAQKIIKNLNKNKTLICSNLASPYGEHVKQLKLNCLLSYEVGYIKPKKEMYELCLKKLNTKASNTLFVGDNYISDYLSPKKIGFKSLLLKRQ